MSKESYKEIFISTLIVENFPSRVELFQKLDNFLSENKYPKDYKSNNKDNAIYFVFKNPDVCFNFVKMINIEKVRNPIYSKIKTNVVVDVKKEILDASALKKKKKGVSSPQINLISEQNVSPYSKKKGDLFNDFDYSTILPRVIILIYSRGKLC